MREENGLERDDSREYERKWVGSSMEVGRSVMCDYDHYVIKFNKIWRRLLDMAQSWSGVALKRICNIVQHNFSNAMVVSTCHACFSVLYDTRVS